MFNNKIYVNARAIIEKEVNGTRYVLLQTRAKPSEPETLEFAGGQIEVFESIEACLKREVLEETGLTISKILGNPAPQIFSEP